MYRPVLVTPPAAAPISLEEVKAQLDVDADDRDALITGLIAAAVSHLDGWTGILGRCLVAQTWRQDFDRFNRCMRLPLFPVASIGTLAYDDPDGAEQTVGAGNYDLRTDDLGAYVRAKDTYSFPSVHDDRPAVHVAYTAGYANADEVPAAIKQAMFLLIRHWFDNPSAVVVGVTAQTVPMAVDALLAPFRRIRF